jgi:AcrR family transcriptional regulator
MVDRQRAKRSEMVREEIIEAALAEFTERGYHQTSIAHIATRLGSGHSMFYRYFQNKRDILEQVVQHSMARTMAILAEVSSPGPITTIDEFRDFSERLGIALVAAVCEDPRLSRLLVLQGSAVDLEMTQQFCRGFDAGCAVLAEHLRSAIEIGYVRADIDVTAVADSIVAIPLGLLARYGHDPERDVLTARVRATADLVIHGIDAGATLDR